MTAEELYEDLRQQSVTSSNQWDDLDYLTGFGDDVPEEFPPWNELTPLAQAIFLDRSASWLARRNNGT